MSIVKRFEHPGLWLLGPLFFIPFVLFGLGILEPVYFVGALIVAIYMALLIINFEAGFLTLIFIRSSLDYIKNFTGTGVNIAGLVSLALIVLGVFYILYRRINILEYEDSKPFLVFVGLCGLSILYSPDTMESLSDWLRMLSIFSVYILTRTIFTSLAHIRTAFMVLLLSALVPVLLGYFQLLTGIGTIRDGGQDRIVGTFLHPNPFASYLMIILVFCAALILERKDFLNRKLLIGFSLLTAGVFLMTFSRGAWIVFVAAMGFMGVLRYRRLLGLIPPVLVAAVLLVPGVQARIMDALDPDYSKGRSAWEWRLETWEEVGELIEKSPWLGHGLSTVEVVFGILTHNDYLRLIVEVGIIGLLSYLVLAFSLLKNTWKDFIRIESPVSKSLQVGLLAMIMGFLIREFADNTLRNTVVMIYFWAFIALVRNTGRIYAEKEREGNALP